MGLASFSNLPDNNVVHMMAMTGRTVPQGNGRYVLLLTSITIAAIAAGRAAQCWLTVAGEQQQCSAPRTLEEISCTMRHQPKAASACLRRTITVRKGKRRDEEWPGAITY